MCLFNDTLNTFYLHLHGFGNIVKNYLDTFKLAIQNILYAPAH